MVGLREAFLDIQPDLFDLGGELCIPGYENVSDAQVAAFAMAVYFQGMSRDETVTLTLAMPLTRR